MNSALFDVLRKVTTATISTMLLKKGIRRCWMNGPKPLVPGGERLIGPAFNPLKLTNQTNLAAAGMRRNTKVKALRELQEIGLITLQPE
jgi:hypothetical protein